MFFILFWILLQWFLYGRRSSCISIDTYCLCFVSWTRRAIAMHKPRIRIIVAIFKNEWRTIKTEYTVAKIFPSLWKECLIKMQFNRMCKCTIFSCLLSILINPTCTLDNGVGVNSSATESISYSITSLIDLITDPTIRKMCNFTTVIIIISKKE